VDRKRHINTKKNETLGLDIGSAAVKLIALRKDEKGYSAVAAGLAEIAASDNDEIRHRMNTVKAIRSCFVQSRPKRKLAVCGISGPEVAVRDFELELLSSEEMTAAVSLEASQVCPFSAEASAIDYQLISSGTDTAKGILVAAMHSLIADKTQLARDARLKCVLMDVDGLALLNCFQGLTESSEETNVRETVGILNVGNSLTTLAIIGRDGCPFIRDMTCAGEEIIRQIAAENGSPVEDVREMLSGGSAATDQGLHGTMSRACRKLITDINETLRYYVAQSKSASIGTLHVCGGFALAEGFIELLNDEISADCILWNPFDRMQCSPDPKYKDVFEQKGPAFAVAAGLAMRSIDVDH